MDNVHNRKMGWTSTFWAELWAREHTEASNLRITHLQVTGCVTASAATMELPNFMARHETNNTACFPAFQVAIKMLKEKCMTVSAMMCLPEVKALRRLSHPNIIQCNECILENRSVHLVFELMTDGDLVQFSKDHSSRLSDHHIAGIAYQILAALSHIHSSNFLHRDIKPENILLSYPVGTSDGKRSGNAHVPDVKVGDLGLAKELTSDTSQSRPHTSYVATRWYRAPEQLLRIPTYGAAADIWAAGACLFADGVRHNSISEEAPNVTDMYEFTPSPLSALQTHLNLSSLAAGATIAELVSGGEPLFPGDDEIETLSSIFSLRGHPALAGWPRGACASARIAPHLPKSTPAALGSAMRGASPAVLQLLDDLLQLDPNDRPTAATAMEYPLFQMYCPQLMGGHDNSAAPSAKRQRLATAALSSRTDTQETGAGLGQRHAPTPTRQTQTVCGLREPGVGTDTRLTPLSVPTPVSRRPDRPRLVPEGKQPTGTYFDIAKRQDADEENATTTRARPHRRPAGDFRIPRGKLQAGRQSRSPSL